MTDTALLDGLQRLFEGNVVVLRSCRSGVKMEVCNGSIVYADEHEQFEGLNYRQYYGGPGNEPYTDDFYGHDIRVVIEKAIAAESGTA